MKAKFSSKKPIICVPIVAKNKEEIIDDVKTCVAHHVSCIEWRMDYFEHVDMLDEVLHVLQDIHEYLLDTILIATFRTKEEGGEHDIKQGGYLALLQVIDQSGLVDYIDIEGYSKPDIYYSLQPSKTDVIVSYHNFDKVPANLYDILNQLQALHAAVIKVACMPQTTLDLDVFKQVMNRFNESYDGLLIAIAMGKLGKETRMQPLQYHSCLTFACFKQASAPGQISYDELRTKLEDMQEDLHLQ